MTRPLSRRRLRKTTTLPDDHDPTTENAVVAGDDFASALQRYAKYNVSTGFAPLEFLQTRRQLLAHRRFGKTMLMAGQHDTAYLDFDIGSTNRAMGARSARFLVRSYQEFDGIFAEFLRDAERGRFPFKHVVFDTIDTMRGLVRDKLSAAVGKDIVDYGKEGKGYDLMSAECLRYLLATTRVLRVGWTVLGHLRYRDVRDEDGTPVKMWAAAVNPALSDGIAQLADLLLEIHRVPVRVSKKGSAKPVYSQQYILQTITPPERQQSLHELGTRIPLNAEIVLPKIGGIDLLETEYERAVAAERSNWE